MLINAMRWLVALVPLAFLAGPVPGEVVIGIVDAAFLVHCLRTRDWGWLRNPWVVALGLLWLQFVLGGLLAQDSGDAVWRGGWWVRYPLLVVALSQWVLTDESSQRRVLASLTLAVVLLTLDMLFQFVHDSDFIGRHAEQMVGYVRLTGPFGAPRAGITLLMLGFPALFYLFARTAALPRPRSTLLGGLSFLLLFGFVAAIYFSGERMAFLLCLLGLAFSMLVAVRHARLLCCGAVVASLGLLIALALANPQYQARQVGQTRDTVAHFTDSAYGRIWQSAIAVGKAHPLLGVGLKNFRGACPNPAYGPSPELRCGAHAHNLYLELFAESGYPGMMLFIAAAALWLLQCWRRRADVRRDFILAGLLIALLLRLWPVAAVTSQFNPWAAGPFWLFAGMLLARLRLLDRSHA